MLLASSCPSDGRLKIFDSGAGGAHLDIEDGRADPDGCNGSRPNFWPTRRKGQWRAETVDKSLAPDWS